MAQLTARQDRQTESGGGVLTAHPHPGTLSPNNHQSEQAHFADCFMFPGLMGEGTRLETRVLSTTGVLSSHLWDAAFQIFLLEMSKVRDMGKCNGLSPPLRGPGQTVEGRGGHVTPRPCLPGRPPRSITALGRLKQPATRSPPGGWWVGRKERAELGHGLASGMSVGSSDMP